MAKYLSDIFKGKAFKGDKVIWMIWFLLCMISLVEVYSASSRMTFDNTSHIGPMLNQASFLAGGLLLILGLHNIPCKWYMLFPLLLLPVALCFLTATAFGLTGGAVNGTNRWMSIAGISFQPSEFAKGVLIMTVAVILAKFQAEQKKVIRGREKIVVGAVRGKRYYAFATVGVLSLIVCGLIFKDNVSTAIMLFAVIVAMMFFAHVPMDLMLKGLFGIGVLAVIAVGLSMVMEDATIAKIPLFDRVVTVKHRVLRSMGKGEDEETKARKEAEYNDFVTKLSETCPPDTKAFNDAIAEYKKKKEIAELLGDKNSQTTYAKIAVANSNVIGLGPGNSVQRDFLQHAESDFIYAIIVEETGLLGALVVMILYVVLFIRCGRIAQKCRTFFPAYLVLGYGLMMMLQALVNMAVAVGAIPVTGQTLPLISKGGSSILIISFYFGMILSVSRYATAQTQTKLADNPDVEGETLEYTTDGTMV